ncbi:hypothetical protein QJQ45_010541 [Haematococcus lacustris]|nr:hypothetical protein QJQ45_010541 [Haematococcus lacustris]
MVMTRSRKRLLEGEEATVQQQQLVVQQPQQEPQPQLVLEQPLPPPPVPLHPLHAVNMTEQLLAAYAADEAFASMVDQYDQDQHGLYRTRERNQIVVPNCSELKTRILVEMHDAQFAGHVGITKTLERISRMFWWPCLRSESDWPFFLSLAEFAVNNSWQESIQSTPFLVNTGQSPLTPALLELTGEVYCPIARRLSEWWQSNVKQARHFMELAQRRQAYMANKGRKEVEYHTGQLVPLSTKNLRMKPDLPQAMARLHPVFHVCLLRPYTSEHPHLPPPVEWLDEAPLYERREEKPWPALAFGLFEAGLLHAPSFRLQLDRQCCDKLLSPRVVAALRARTCKLAITLEQPRVQDSRLLVEVLGKLGICTAVEACKLSSLEEPSLVPAMPLDCSRSLAQCLVDSFPALTSLSLHSYAIPCSGLAALLSHPQLSLQLQQLDLSSTTILQPLVVESPNCKMRTMGGDPSLIMAAVHNLTQACKVPVRINDLWLSQSSRTTGEEQQEQLEQWVAVLQPLKLHCSWGTLTVYNLDVGGAGRLEADISALAPFCQGCTRLSFNLGRVEPSLEFWRQLVQLMPTISDVVFEDIDGSTSSDMHESLQLMAQQPWARWLDIRIRTPESNLPYLPACWQASPLFQLGKLKVSFESCW